MPQLPPAGWLQDPQSPAQMRYWDGAAWTTHVAPAHGAPTPPTPERTGLSRGEKTAIVAVVVAPILLGLIAAIAIPIYLNFQ
ncbi:MAG: DUF2510 domain-containing protein [Actinomycetes bacterium]|jgi:hypothetical protein